jgi:hypothetical protein
MQSLNAPVALAIVRDRRAAAAARRAVSPPGRDPAPPGRPARALAVLAARAARRLDAEAAARVLKA